MTSHSRTTIAAMVIALALGAVHDAGADAAPSSSAGSGSTAPDSSAMTTAPPTSAPASTGEAKVLLEETFDDDTNRWSPEAVDDEFATGTIDEGVLSFSQSASFLETLPEGRVPVPPIVWPSVLDPLAAELTDVRVDTTIALTSGATAGVACGVDPTGARVSAYFVTLSSTGVVAIAKYFDDDRFEVIAREPDAPAGGPAALPAEPAFDYDPADAYRLAAECRLGAEQAEITLELDGEILLTAVDVDDPIADGVVGVHHSESTLLNQIEGFQPYGVVFDDLVVTELAADADGSGGPAIPLESDCADGTGDQTDDKGNAVTAGNESTDLVQVSLRSDGTTLVVTYELAGTPPSDTAVVSDRALRWVTTLSTPDRRLVIETILHGDELRAQLAEPARGDTIELVPELTGSTLSVPVPLAGLEVPSAFDWTAYTEWYPLTGSAPRVDDRCPDDASVVVERGDEAGPAGG